MYIPAELIAQLDEYELGIMRTPGGVWAVYDREEPFPVFFKGDSPQAALKARVDHVNKGIEDTLNKPDEEVATLPREGGPDPTLYWPDGAPRAIFFVAHRAAAYHKLTIPEALGDAVSKSVKHGAINRMNGAHPLYTSYSACTSFYPNGKTTLEQLHFSQNPDGVITKSVWGDEKQVFCVDERYARDLAREHRMCKICSKLKSTDYIERPR